MCAAVHACMHGKSTGQGQRQVPVPHLKTDCGDEAKEERCTEVAEGGVHGARCPPRPMIGILHCRRRRRMGSLSCNLRETARPCSGAWRMRPRPAHRGRRLITVARPPRCRFLVQTCGVRLLGSPGWGAYVFYSDTRADAGHNM